MGGTQFYFTGSTYPVFNMPLGSESLPTNQLNIKNIIFMIENPASAQANTVWAFNCDGWNAGTWNNVFWINDAFVSSVPTVTPHIKGLTLKPGWDHDRLQINSMTILAFGGNVAEFYADHLLVGTLTIGNCSGAIAGDVGYNLVLDDMYHQIQRLDLYASSHGIYINSTYHEQVIDSLSTEGAFVDVITCASIGKVKVGTYQRNNTSSIDSTLWSNANIDQLCYDSPPGYGGRVNSTQGIGIGGIKNVSQLLPLLGDVCGLWPLFENTTSTAIKDYSLNGYNAVASKNTRDFATPGIIKGCSNVVTVKSGEYFTVNDNNNFTFGNGAIDSPFSVGIAVYNIDYEWGGGLVTKYAPGQKEWRLSFDPHCDRVQFELYDNTGGGYKIWLSTTIALNTWHILTATFDGTTPIIYDNGIPLVTTLTYTADTYTAMRNTTSKLGIGCDGDGTGEAEGTKLAWAFLTAKNLSVTEVWSITRILKDALELP